MLSPNHSAISQKCPSNHSKSHDKRAYRNSSKARSNISRIQPETWKQTQVNVPCNRDAVNFKAINSIGRTKFWNKCSGKITGAIATWWNKLRRVMSNSLTVHRYVSLLWQSSRAFLGSRVMSRKWWVQDTGILKVKMTLIRVEVQTDRVYGARLQRLHLSKRRRLKSSSRCSYKANRSIKICK